MSDSTTSWTIAHQAPLSMGVPGQKHWSGLPFLSPRDLPDPGTELASPTLAGRFLSTAPQSYLKTVNMIFGCNYLSHHVLKMQLLPPFNSIGQVNETQSPEMPSVALINRATLLCYCISLNNAYVRWRPS